MYYYYRMTTPREAKKKPERLLAQKVRVHLNNRQERWMAAHCAARRIAYNFAVDVLSQQKSAGQCFVAVKSCCAHGSSAGWTIPSILLLYRVGVFLQAVSVALSAV